MIAIKPGASVSGMRPEILLAVTATAQIYQSYGHDFILTECSGGKHGAGSLHYVGLAFDCRISQIHPPSQVQEITDKLKACLGPEYDVVLETDHIHVEFQPK